MIGWLLEMAAMASIMVYATGRGLGEIRSRDFFLRFALVVGAAWLAEETSILLYGFYAYSPKWNFFLGHVPLVVILAWPAVILSGRDLVTQLMGPEKRLLPLAAAALVGADAALVEPVAVNAGLWAWREPGIFGVPPVAVLGWAFFALGCNLLLSRYEREKMSGKRALAFLVLPAVLAHVLLLATWWGALRWVSVPLDPALATGAAWAVSLSLVWAVFKKSSLGSLEPRALWLRLPAAALIFSLLFFKHSGTYMLIPYALAFAPPYLALLGRRYLGPGRVME